MGSRFCFVTDPVGHGDQKFYFDSEFRDKNFGTEVNNIDHCLPISKQFGLDLWKCNTYYYDFLYQNFRVLFVNSEIDDSASAEQWARSVDYRPIIGQYKRLFFTKRDYGKYQVALNFLEMFQINFSIIHNPYPDDKSENYLVDFEDNQTEHYLGLGAYLSTSVGLKDGILFFLYGFDVLEIFRYCDKDAQGISMSNIWNDSQIRTVDLVLNKLINYYGVVDRYDLYPYIFEDIIKKYKIWRPSFREVVKKQEFLLLLIQLENEMTLDRDMPSRGKSEQEMYRIIHKMFPDAVFRYENWDWLGYQHLDVFVPSKKLAFEFRGAQNYRWRTFGGTNLPLLDKIKRESCIREGIRLIEWSFREPLTSATLASKLGTKTESTQPSLF